jgi:tRNA(adenine34) deaminase
MQKSKLRCCFAAMFYMNEEVEKSALGGLTDQKYMQLAIEQAGIAEQNGDVPIGAVIVCKDQIIGKAYNQREQLADPTAHAEIIALTQAAAALENWHLNDCTMYVTLEPCPMCAGALVLSRMDRLVYGCDDPKSGACGSLYNIVQDGRLNHRLEVKSGVLEEDCREQLQSFFQRRRDGKAELKTGN